MAAKDSNFLDDCGLPRFLLVTRKDDRNPLDFFRFSEIPLSSFEASVSISQFRRTSEAFERPLISTDPPRRILKHRSILLRWTGQQRVCTASVVICQWTLTDASRAKRICFIAKCSIASGKSLLSRFVDSLPTDQETHLVLPTQAISAPGVEESGNGSIRSAGFDNPLSFPALFQHSNNLNNCLSSKSLHCTVKSVTMPSL